MSISVIAQKFNGLRTPVWLPRSALLRGACTLAGMASLYFGVLIISVGADHAREQWLTYWWMLTPLWLMSAAQVSMITAMPRARGRHVRGAVFSAGSTSAGMLACCAHHAAELLPIIGVAGLAGVLAAWQSRILILALLITSSTTISTVRRWRRTSMEIASAQRPQES